MTAKRGTQMQTRLETASRRRPELSLAGFHDGLRRLGDYRVVRLLPDAGQLAEPEYALIDGATVLYSVVKEK